MLLTSASLTAQIVLACLTALGLTQDSLKPPSFSQQATAIWENIWIQNKPVGTIKIPSPDETKTVTAAYDQKTDRTLLTIAAGTRRFKTEVEGTVGSELAWAPDSKAFFLTYSDAGLDGEYHTLVFYVSEHGLRKVNPDLVIKRAFGNPVSCLGPTIANVVGVAWLGDSHRMLIAAQVPTLTICDSYGTFKVFEISLPDAIVIKPYGQLAAKKQFWPYLGKDLRDARDNCITDPKSCYSADHESHEN